MSALEKHYTCSELADLWNVTPDMIRALFRDTPGVLKITRPATRFKRVYTSYRIPESIAQKRHAELNGTKAA